MKVLEGAGGGQLAVEREMQGGGAQGLQVTHLFWIYRVNFYDILEKSWHVWGFLPLYKGRFVTPATISLTDAILELSMV